MIDYGNTYKAGDMRPDIRFDAYRSNTVYGESSSVQPPALQTLIIIKAWNDAGWTVKDVPYVELSRDALSETTLERPPPLEAPA